ncbi:MAG: nuclear transport factor 2 family protein [Xanthobacteraceae bacterium]
MATADEAATIKEVKAAFTALDDAFARQDKEAIKRKMTADHIAITSYYGAPQSVTEQIASLPDLKLKETTVSAVAVTLFGSDSAAIMFTARNEGTYKGQPLPSPVFVTSLYVKRNGHWLERLYQTTVLKP